MDVAALVARFEQYTPEDEATLLKQLTEAGWEAGCWLRLPPERLVSANQQEISSFVAALRDREGFARAAVADPYPNGRPHEPIEGDEACFVILSQRCDIVGLLKAEPLIELAPASYCTSKDRIKTGWKNSPREFPVEPTSSATFMVDLRYRFFLPKIDLAELEPKQALPIDEPEYQVRQRFVLRAAQRYTRAAVPDHLVEKVVLPLGGIVKDDAEANAIFTEWALLHGGRRDERPGVIATYQMNIPTGLDDDEQAEAEDRIREIAEDKFHQIVEALPATAKAELDLDDDRRTRAISESELTVAAWRLSWKLEWDEVSFTGDSDAATPGR
jgi:hypothetical protein